MAKTAAERQRDMRKRKRDIRYPCVLDYHVNPQDYIPRLAPDKLNWGPWMNSSELEHAEHNRVPIPGDWDYKGVA